MIAMPFDFVAEVTCRRGRVRAIEGVLAQEGLRTRDLKGRAGTTECGKAIADALA